MIVTSVHSVYSLLTCSTPKMFERCDGMFRECEWISLNAPTGHVPLLTSGVCTLAHFCDIKSLTNESPLVALQFQAVPDLILRQMFYFFLLICLWHLLHFISLHQLTLYPLLLHPEIALGLPALTSALAVYIWDKQQPHWPKQIVFDLNMPLQLN